MINLIFDMLSEPLKKSLLMESNKLLKKLFQKSQRLIFLQKKIFFWKGVTPMMFILFKKEKWKYTIKMIETKKICP